MHCVSALPLTRRTGKNGFPPAERDKIGPQYNNNNNNPNNVDVELLILHPLSEKSAFYMQTIDKQQFLFLFFLPPNFKSLFKCHEKKVKKKQQKKTKQKLRVALSQRQGVITISSQSGRNKRKPSPPLIVLLKHIYSTPLLVIY